MFCANCGKELTPGAQFCASCGHAIAGDSAHAVPGAAPATTAVTPPAPVQRHGFLGWLRGLKTWKKVVLGIATFIVAVVALALWATSGLDEPVKRHFAALHAGDVTGAYSELSVAARQTTSLDAFKAMLAANPALTHVTGESFASRSYQDSQGHLQGMLEIDGGGQVPIEVNLVKENGAWKILSYHATGTNKGGEGQATDSSQSR